MFDPTGEYACLESLERLNKIIEAMNAEAAADTERIVAGNETRTLEFWWWLSCRP